jgi:hypothetical protein
MLVPNFIFSKLVYTEGEQKGHITEEWEVYFSQLQTQLQTNFSNEGLVAPSQSSFEPDNFAIIQPVAQPGTLLFDETNDALNLRLQDGEFHPLQIGGLAVLTIDGTAGDISANRVGQVVTIDLINTSVTPGNYAYPTDIIVDGKGRITSITSGVGPIESVSGTTNEINVTSGVNPVVSISSNPIIPGTGAITVPAGSVAQRTTPTNGLRFNTDSNVYELYYPTISSWQTIDVSGGTVTGVFGTAGQIVVTPSSPNPTVSIDPTYIGQTSITTLGTITTGTWHGATIGTGYGGTGLTATPTNGQLSIGNGTGYTLATLTAGSGVSISNGSGSISISATGTGGTVTSLTAGANITLSPSTITTTGSIALSTTITQAGTIAIQDTSATAFQVQTNSSASTIFAVDTSTPKISVKSVIDFIGSTSSRTIDWTTLAGNQALYADTFGSLHWNASATSAATWTVNNSSGLPAFSVGNNNQIQTFNSQLDDGSGNMAVAGSITLGTWAASAISYAYGGTGLTATPSNGQIPIGNGAGYTLATLTQGSGVTIANGAGAVTISATGTGGTVTSLTSGANIALTPSTITGTGSIAVVATPTFSGLSSSGNIIPTVDNTYNIGSAVAAWNSAYLNTIYTTNNALVIYGSSTSTPGSIQIEASLGGNATITLQPTNGVSATGTLNLYGNSANGSGNITVIGGNNSTTPLTNNNVSIYGGFSNGGTLNLSGGSSSSVGAVNVQGGNSSTTPLANNILKLSGGGSNGGTASLRGGSAGLGVVNLGFASAISATCLVVNETAQSINPGADSQFVLGSAIVRWSTIGVNNITSGTNTLVLQSTATSGTGIEILNSTGAGTLINSASCIIQDSSNGANTLSVRNSSGAAVFGVAASTNTATITGTAVVSTLTASQAVISNGSKALASGPLTAVKLVNYAAGALPITSSVFTYNGGTLIFICSGSGYTATPNASYSMAVGIYNTGGTLIASLGSVGLYFNNGGVHLTLVPQTFVLGAGTLTVGGVYDVHLTANSGLTTDSNDRFDVTMITLPY